MSDLKAALEASLARGLPPLAPIRELGELAPWPAPGSTAYVSKPGGRHYKSMTGDFPDPLVGVTSILKVIGLGTEGLIKWSANEERKACLDACGTVYGDWAKNGIRLSAGEFSMAVESNLGPARSHQKQLTKAADIGTAAHAAISDWLTTGKMSGDLSDASLWAVMSFQDWWKESGLKVVRSEQPVWDVTLGYAGTVDIIAQAPDGSLGVLDIKSSKGVYETHHLQVAAYMHAARNWAPIQWGKIVRVPKTSDETRIEVKDLGDCYSRKLTESDLMEAFKAALTAWRVLLA
jgi:hypothetical protein